MASQNVGSIHYDLGLDTSKYDQAAGKIGDKTSKIKNAFKVIGVAALAAGAAAVTFGVQSVKAFNAANEAQTKLRTNMLNVKGATEDQVQSLFKLSSALQSVGVIEDDVIKAGMSQLATFNLQASTIEKLTPKIADMVAQLKGHNATAEDMVTINNLVGKVMTGNIGALSRYGVTLSENQALQLKNASETEKAALLVEVLAQNYGDVNKALRNTPQGRVTALKNEFGDFQELIGEKISTMFDPALEGIDKWLQSIGGVQGAYDALEKKMKPFVDNVISSYNSIKNYLEPKLKDLQKAINENVSPAMKQFFDNVLVPVGHVLGVIIVGAIGFVIDAFTTLINFLGNVKSTFERAFAEIVEDMQPFIDAFNEHILPVLKEVWTFIETEFKKAWDELTKAFEDLGNELKKAGIDIDVAKVAIVILGIAIVALVAPILIIVGVFTALIYIIVKVVTWFTQMQTAVARFTGEAKNNIVNFVNDMVKNMSRFGTDLINGLTSGIRSAVGALWQEIRNIANGISSLFRNIMQIRSPSRVFAGFGEEIVNGLVQGIDSTAGAAQRTALNLAKTVSDNFNANTEFSMSANVARVSDQQAEGLASTIQPVSSDVSINGNIIIGNQQDADYFFGRLGRNMSLSSMGVAERS
jgi:predicted PurR-regulated permease PerM